LTFLHRLDSYALDLDKNHLQRDDNKLSNHQMDPQIDGLKDPFGIQGVDSILKFRADSDIVKKLTVQVGPTKICELKINVQTFSFYYHQVENGKQVKKIFKCFHHVT